MPDSGDYQGLSRKVLRYSESFLRIVNKIKQPGFSEADWAPLEELVDVTSFRRMGVFLTNRAEVSNWQQYKQLITQYGGATAWEGTLRRITRFRGSYSSSSRSETRETASLMFPTLSPSTNSTRPASSASLTSMYRI
jgi:hypothetical protein